MSKLISKRLKTTAAGKYSAAVSFTSQEAKATWKAVDEALKLARRSKADPTTVQVLANVKRGLQEANTHLRFAEQRRTEGRYQKEHGEL